MSTCFLRRYQRGNCAQCLKQECLIVITLCSETPTHFDSAPSYPDLSAQLEVQCPFVGLCILRMEMQFHKPSLTGLWLAISTKVFWTTFIITKWNFFLF